MFHASHHLVNPPRKPKLTATIFDMTCWLMPEMHTAGNVTATKRYAERILRRADGLIAISESTRNDAVRILGLREDAIQVIYPGVSQAFFETIGCRPGTRPADLRPAQALSAVCGLRRAAQEPRQRPGRLGPAGAGAAPRSGAGGRRTLGME